MSKFSVIAAYLSSTRGIGYVGRLPWNIPKDMKRFADVTKHSNIIMGRNTWESLPHTLPHRNNIVISRSQSQLGHKTVPNLNTALDHCRNTYDGRTFVIGGEQLYREAISHPSCDKLYLTEIISDMDYKCDTFFPEIPSHYKVIAEEEVEGDAERLRFVTYQNMYDYTSDEYQYVNLIRDIIVNGEYRQGRNGGVYTIFGPQHVFDLERGFPLLTTKKMFFRGIVEELLFFLRGNTDSRILEDKGVRIWQGNITREFLDQRGLHHYKEGDMGPMYGFLWRHFGAKYHGADHEKYDEGYDQLYHLLNDIVNEPFSRRLLLTTYDPSAVSKSVLAPCHGLTTQFSVSGDGRLHCKMYQRSVDVGLGYPFNIASYAALIHIICEVTGLVPGRLIMTLGDTHIYENHVSALREQCKRVPYRFPKMRALPPYRGQKNNVHEMIEYIESLSAQDFKMEEYMSHGRVKMDMVA